MTFGDESDGDDDGDDDGEDDDDGDDDDLYSSKFKIVEAYQAK